MLNCHAISFPTDFVTFLWAIFFELYRKWRLTILGPSDCCSQVTLGHTWQMNTWTKHRGSYFKRGMNFKLQTREYRELSRVRVWSQNILCFTDICSSVPRRQTVDCQGPIHHFRPVFRQTTNCSGPRDAWLRLTSSSAGDGDILLFLSQSFTGWQTDLWGDCIENLHNSDWFHIIYGESLPQTNGKWDLDKISLRSMSVQCYRCRKTDWCWRPTT